MDFFGNKENPSSRFIETIEQWIDSPTELVELSIKEIPIENVFKYNVTL